MSTSAPDPEQSGQRTELPRWLLSIYALPALPLALLTLPLYVIVPTHYAQLGVPAALVGFVLLAVRLFDAVIDPVAGWLADRTRSRFGRRRTWFAAGIAPTCVAAFALFVPPAGIGDGFGATYLFGWGVVLSIGWTIALVPYNAWGTELSTSYAGRNRVAAWRESMTFLGTLLALTTFAISADSAVALSRFAIFIVVALPFFALLVLWRVPEPRDHSRGKLSISDGFSHLARNHAFIRLLASFFFNSLANGFPATLFLLYVTEKLRLPATAAGQLLVVYVLSGIVAVPGWLWLARHWPKHQVWGVAMLLACAAFVFAPFLPEGSWTGFLIICVITGFAVGADLILPASLQGDAIDVDTAASGEQRSGLYLSIWGLATKLALALAVGIAFPLLSVVGFDATAGGIKTTEGRFVLGLLYAGAPVVLKLVAVALMWRFPIDAPEQARLRTVIETR